MPATESLPVPAEIEVKKPETAIEVKATPSVADTIKAMEAEEPILQENPHRFVLFPLKYHEIWQSTYTL
jgi:ribonucleoside-diphosphate reductase subunit M2